MRHLIFVTLAAATAVAGEPHRRHGQTIKQTTTVTADSTANASAAGGDATATSGNSNASSQYISTTPQQVPATAQGSFAIQGCAAAGNVGGANSHGAGFLGFGFTPDECYRFMLAQAYQAVGQAEAACETLNRTDAALNLETKRGLPLPTCHVAPQHTEITQGVVAVPVPDAVTHQELREVEARIVDRTVGK